MDATHGLVGSRARFGIERVHLEPFDGAEVADVAEHPDDEVVGTATASNLLDWKCLEVVEGGLKELP